MHQGQDLADDALLGFPADVQLVKVPFVESSSAQNFELFLGPRVGPVRIFGSLKSQFSPQTLNP